MALFTCFIYGLVKRVKEKVNMIVQPPSNFHGRKRSVYVMLKWSVKERKCLYGELVPNDTVTGTISRNEMDTHTDTCYTIVDWQLLDFTNKVWKVTNFGFVCTSKEGNGYKVWYSMDISQYRS
jgi:hypothetical protein